jgi:hypothetical protein
VQLLSAFNEGINNDNNKATRYVKKDAKHNTSAKLSRRCNFLSFPVVSIEIKERIAAGNRAYHVHKKTIYIKTNIPKRQTTSL